MFALNLKEIELTPRIEEDRSFSHEDEIDLEAEVLKYITKTYPDKYKNPMTVGRKIREAIRNEEGKNQTDKLNDYTKKSDMEMEEMAKKRQVAEEASDKEFEPKNEELRQWKSKELNRIYNEYQTKLDAIKNPDEQKTLEEERIVKLEDLDYEYNQKFDELMKEWNTKKNVAKNQT